MDARNRMVIDHYEACRLMGRRAARKGTAYTDNPMPEGTRGHLEWSKGHNEARARLRQGVQHEGRLIHALLKGRTPAPKENRK